MNTRYIALLRGINVGGNNIIKMTDLKSCFEQMGFSNVKTYIQSGNVLFNSDEKSASTLVTEIEKAISERFHYTSSIVLISQEQLQEIIANAPADFGEDSSLYRYDVLFLKPPLTAEEAIKDIRTIDGIDNLYSGKGVLYFSRLIEKAHQSYLNKLVMQPIYKQMTIRNWNTSTKLMSL